MGKHGVIYLPSRVGGLMLAESGKQVPDLDTYEATSSPSPVLHIARRMVTNYEDNACFCGKSAAAAL